MLYDRMPFGKHKGKLLEDVPVTYLLWVLRETDPDPWLKSAIRRVLEVRGYDSDRSRQRQQQQHEQSPPPQSPVAVGEVLREWWHGLARDFHPDRGGSHEVMVALVEARDRLKRMVGV